MFLLTYWKVWLVVAFMAFTAFVGYKAYKIGGSAMAAKYEEVLLKIQKATDAEIVRQETVNNKALKDANDQINQLNTEVDNLNQELLDNDVQAAKDRNAQSKCVGSASVRRLNSYSAHKAKPQPRTSN